MIAPSQIRKCLLLLLMQLLSEKDDPITMLTRLVRKPGPRDNPSVNGSRFRLGVDSFHQLHPRNCGDRGF